MTDLFAIARPIHASLSGGRVLSKADVYNRVRPVIDRLWEDGTLPMASGKQWIIGVKVDHEHFGGTSIRFIKVGPGKPHKFRPQNLVCRWKPWMRGEFR